MSSTVTKGRIARSIVLVTDSGTLAVYRVDSFSGARTTVADNGSPGQPGFAWPHGIVARSIFVDRPLPDTSRECRS